MGSLQIGAGISMGAGVTIQSTPASGNFLALCSSTGASFNIYPWRGSAGFGTKLADPATAAGTVGNGVAWSPI